MKSGTWKRNSARSTFATRPESGDGYKRRIRNPNLEARNKVEIPEYYVSTSRIVDNTLHLGDIDTNTYPIWWMGSMDLSGDLNADRKTGTIIPLRAIVSGQGGPSMNRHFNLYYLHWWSLTHFLMHCENDKYRDGLSRLIADGGGLAAFEQRIGPVDSIESQWYGYLAELQKRTGRATPPVKLKLQAQYLRFEIQRIRMG